MSLSAILLLILLGIILMLIEFLVVPGISVAGIGGVICLISGVIAAYYFKGPKIGNYILLATLVFSIFSIVFAFQSKTWRKMGLHSEIDSRVTPFESGKIKNGDLGKTLTRLNPIGKAIVNDIVCEAKSISGIIDSNSEIEVVKVLNTQIIVKLK
jgi:membrane-bound ClpP family serine protease